MTDENKALLAELFSRYGSPSTDGEIRITRYLTRADQLNRPADIKRYDENALYTIAELEKTIETLKAYRLSLAERYNYLSTTPTVPVVRLERHRGRYDNKVYYYLQTFRRMIDDGAEVKESEVKYSGTDRRKALADFNAYVKAHPGIIAEKDIEPAKWER